MITQFMLTKNDLTIPDGLEVYREVASLFTPDQLSYVGFKNVGQTHADLERLGYAISEDGRKVVLEIVGGTTAQDEIKAAKMAQRIGAHCLIGGEHVHAVLDVIGSSDLMYAPAVGDITKELGKLHGSVDDIVIQAREYENLGVDGIMLLAYRFVGELPILLTELRNAISIKIVAAGSVNGRTRIRQLCECGVWAYTIGSAVLDDQMTEEKGLKAQLDYTLAIAGEEAAAVHTI